jgi:integrase/recombinase XerD
MIKELPNPRWSEKYDMVILLNTPKNIQSIFDKFKGVAWVNCQYFFINRPIHNGNEVLSVDDYRKRKPKPHWKYCPEAFYQKLEVRKYSLNTARVYIAMFEKFMNHYKRVQNLMELGEREISSYLQRLVIEKKSDAYINQAINAIHPVGSKHCLNAPF